MKIPLDKKWIALEKEDYANYLFVVPSWEGYTGNLPVEWGFLPGRFLSAEYIDSSCNLFILKERLDKINREHFKFLFTDPQKWEKLHRITIANSDKMFVLAKSLQKLDAGKLTNKQLLEALRKFFKAQVDVHCPRGPMWFLETPRNMVSDYLYKYLEEKAEHHKPIFSVQEAFQILTAPLQKSIWTKEKEELIKIAEIKDEAERNIVLDKHTKKYEWLEYGLQGKVLERKHFENELHKIIRDGSAKLKEQLKKEQEELRKNKSAVIKTYHIHDAHVRIFKIISMDLYTRLYSKDAQFFGYYCIENLLKEVGKRGYLTLEQVRFLAPKDYEGVLLKGEDLSALANERQKYSIHISDRGKTVFLAGKDAEKMRSKIKFHVEKQRAVGKDEILRGQTAFKGLARGRVKIINTMQEMTKMHEGNILVSHMTNPSIVPAMKKAIGIITDLGGITCHAAIVARELKKPCVIGTKVATQILRDGDEVEMDADKGEIKKCK
ncbi:hypothetical protein KKA13_04695 [Patescibacteria group bacterium]|nr:hypothetical protein [Patescibacteria group bacterium]MBU1613471.1 hypothetical protein [Patescibacteria group bacterium]